MRRLLYRSLRFFSRLDHALRERLSPGGWLVAGAAGAAAVAGLDTNQTVTYRAFAFLAALLALSAGASLVRRPRFEARRILPRYATAGETCTYRVEVVNAGSRPLRDAELRERFRDPRPSYEEWRRTPEPGERRRNWWDRKTGYFRWRWLIERRLPAEPRAGELGWLAPGERRELDLSFRPRRRGRLEFAGLTLGQPDPLGLVMALGRLPLEARLVALPRRYRLPPLPMPGRRKYQPGGVSLAASQGDAEEFLALRDYRPGDPLHRLHWKSFARTGKPVTKEFQDEFFERHALVLDTAGPRGEDEAFEDAVAIAASFVHTLESQECLLDLMFVGGELHTYTAGAGQMRPEHLLEVLAGVGPSPEAEFDALAQAVLSRRATLSSVILVLVAWDAGRHRLVSALRATGADLRVLLVCPPGEPPEGLAAGVTVLHPGAIEQGLAGLR